MIFFGFIGITLLILYPIFSYMKKDIDYRFVIIGPLLPELIDKPIGRLLFIDIFHNGRLIGHTLLFALLLLILGAYLNRKYKFSGVSLLGLGCFMHLIYDQMWTNPNTLFWPLGWIYPKINSLALPGYRTNSLNGYNLNTIQGYWSGILHETISDPSVYIPEIIGLIIIAWFIYRFKLYQLENAKHFIMTGRFQT